MQKGTVKVFLMNLKDLDLFVDSESKNEYFVHVSGLNDQVREK